MVSSFWFLLILTISLETRLRFYTLFRIQPMLNNKPLGEHLMSDIGFGKGERLSNVATHPLTQGIVPPFHMGCLSSFFSNTMMGFCREDVLRGCPKITERMAVLVFIGDGLPQTKAGGKARGRQWQTPRFGVSVGTSLSTTIVC